MAKFLEEIKDILEYIDIKYNKQLFIDLFNKCEPIEPTKFLETTSISKALITKESFRKDWKEILNHHAKVHDVFDIHATGFNYSNDDGYMPAHVDLAKQRHYNLLLPIFGAAEINIYETPKNIKLTFMHNQTHWQVPEDYSNKNLTKMGTVKIDKPVLLNTDYLHDVKIIKAPRLNWVTRWYGMKNYTFSEFKNLVEVTLNV